MKHETFYERNAPDATVVAESLEGAKFAPYWLDAASAAGLRVRRPRLEGHRSTDLVVVGGGFTGLWTAVLAKRRDPARRVVLLEASRIGWAASGRNGGWVDASITHGPINGRTRWPDEYPTLERLGYENLDAMERDIQELGIACDWERVGALSLVLEEHQLEWAAEAGAAGETVLDHDETVTRINAPGALGAVAVSGRGVATVDPAKLVFGLAEAAERLGVEIYERSPVRRLERAADGGVIAVTKRGAVAASHAALATNVFPSLIKRNRLMTVPVYDYVLMTAPLTTEQRALIGWEGREGLGDMANQFHYSQLTKDGRILWGGYDAVYKPGGRIKAEYEDDPEIHAKLASHFFSLFPQLIDTGLTFTHRWAGVIDTSTRFAAFYGTARRGRVAYAAGFTGLGVATVRFAAEVMLDLLSGEETERTQLDMVRHKGIPFPPEPAATVGIQLSRWSLDQADHHEGRRNLFLRTMDAVGLGFDS